MQLNCKTIIFKILFPIIVILPHAALAQSESDRNAIATGKWMYELNPGPFVSLYKMKFFLDESGQKESVYSVLKEQKINIDSIPYAQIKYKDNLYFAIKKNEKSDIRLFKVLKETDKLFILCSEQDSICDCKTNTFLYYKPKLELQRIQRPFSFSLKRNLIKRLDDFGIAHPADYEQLEFCDLLKEI